MVSVRIDGKKLREIRHKADLTQEELASQGGISIDSVRRAERGQAIDRNTASSIGAGLKLDYSQFVKMETTPVEFGTAFSPYDNQIRAIKDRYLFENAKLLDHDDIKTFIRITTASTPEQDKALPIEDRRMMTIPVYSGMPPTEKLKSVNYFLSVSEIDNIVPDGLGFLGVFEKLEHLNFVKWESQPIGWPPPKRFNRSPNMRELYIYHSLVGHIGITQLGTRLLVALSPVSDTERVIGSPTIGRFASSLE